MFGVGLLLARLYFMGYTPPSFSPADNPAADSKVLLTRVLTFLYLPLVNFMLLVFPVTLSFDWSMEAIPLVESLLDCRVIATLVFYSLLLALVKHSLTLFFSSTTNDQPKSPNSHNHQNGTSKLVSADGNITDINGCCHHSGETTILHRRFRRDSSSSAESLRSVMKILIDLFI